MFSASEELIVPASRKNLLGIVLGGAGFVALGVWLLQLARDEGVLYAIVGLASIGFFGLCGVLALWRLVWSTPALVINRQGIVDNASALGVGLIRWDEIADLREYRFNDQVFLGVVPKNLHTLIARQPAWKRSALRANLRLGAPAVNIPQAMLPVSVSELLREIDVRFRR